MRKRICEFLQRRRAQKYVLGEPENHVYDVDGTLLRYEQDILFFDGSKMRLYAETDEGRRRAIFKSAEQSSFLVEPIVKLMKHYRHW